MRKQLLYILPILLCFGCKEDTPTVVKTRGDQSKLEQSLAQTPSIPKSGSPVEPALLIKGPMPTGIAVSHDGRIFVNFPRWGDPVEFTVAEIKGDVALPYPDLATNKLDLSEADK